MGTITTRKVNTMTEKQKILIELELPFCYHCPFLKSSHNREDCSILRQGIQEGEWSNIDFQFDEKWRYNKCPLVHPEGYLKRNIGLKVINND